jgi:hypothetical protein
MMIGSVTTNQVWYDALWKSISSALSGNPEIWRSYAIGLMVIAAFVLWLFWPELRSK